MNQLLYRMLSKPMLPNKQVKDVKDTVVTLGIHIFKTKNLDLDTGY